MKNQLWPVLFCALLLTSRLNAGELNWLTDLGEARVVAANEHKMLLVDFTGSTWCPPCMALHDEVLTGPLFAAFAKEFVLVKLDYPPLRERTPEKIAANPALAKLMAVKERYGVPAYPTVMFLDANGDDHGRLTGYSAGIGAAGYLRKLKSARK